MDASFLENADDERFFLSLYEENFALLFNYGMQVSGDRELVKDCIQDLFIELRTKLGLLKEINSHKAYLFTCLRRKIYREVVQEKKHQLTPIEPGLVLEIPYEHSLIDAQQRDEQQRKLLRAFDHLTARQKEAIYLKFYEELSYEEVAQTMQLEDVKSARNLIYKAIKTLKGELSINPSTPIIPLLIAALNWMEQV
jgi:RNA polymerase sigma factor (sigma-70 family)